jgi:hypothetical protein
MIKNNLKIHLQKKLNQYISLSFNDNQPIHLFYDLNNKVLLNIKKVTGIDR